MLTNKLKTKYLGRNVIFHESIDSTQKEAWRLAKLKIPNGSLVITEIQNDGIGTHGRKWYTTERGNIAFSLIIYLDCNINRLNNLTVDISKIVIGIFKKLYGIRLDIKYPNDIMCNNKKLGGILVETRVIGENAKELIIGIGMNLNQKNFDGELETIATSIKREFGIKVNRDEVITLICNNLENYILKLLSL